MFQGMNFAPAQLPGELEALRAEVREFLNAETDWHPNSDFNAGASPEFSKRFAAKGWIGMTWPKEYGGGGRSFLERYVVTEELLAAGAPVGCHWIPDRQSARSSGRSFSINCSCRLMVGVQMIIFSPRFPSTLEIAGMR